MSTKVTLKLFSGRPDPTFNLTNEETQEIDDICAGFGGATTAAPAGKSGLLGYRGFQLERAAHERGAALDMYVHAGIIDRGTFDNPVDPARMVEHKLLAYAAAKGAVPRELQSYLDKEVEGPPKLQGAPPPPSLGGCPACNAADAPAYNPGAWNSAAVCPYNNCYNYANNQITYTFAQPGRASGTPIVAMTCASVQQSAISDGLAVSPNFSALRTAGQGWYVALVIWPNTDYHWYRQDLTGCWSHKPGGTPATNLDNAGNTITDPALSNNGPYTSFCTYMVTSAHVVIN